MASKKTTADPTKAVGYVRVSTEEQNLGPDAQRAALAAWCDANGVELVAVFDDLGVSGGTAIDKRPGLLAAVDALTDNGAGVLLVMKRDRLARDIMVSAMAERLAERAGARVLATDGTGNGDGPEAQMMRGIIDVFAQYERALIRARTKSALAVKKSRGERTGDIPFGSQLAADGIHLEANPAEQEIMQIVRDLKAGGVTVTAIVDYLNKSGRPARGSRWHRTTVDRLLARVAA